MVVSFLIVLLFIVWWCIRKLSHWVLSIDSHRWFSVKALDFREINSLTGNIRLGSWKWLSRFLFLCVKESKELLHTISVLSSFLSLILVCSIQMDYCLCWTVSLNVFHFIVCLFLRCLTGQWMQVDASAVQPCTILSWTLLHAVRTRFHKAIIVNSPWPIKSSKWQRNFSSSSSAHSAFSSSLCLVHRWHFQQSEDVIFRCIHCRSGLVYFFKRKWPFTTKPIHCQKFVDTLILYLLGRCYTVVYEVRWCRSFKFPFKWREISDSSSVEFNLI